MCPKDCQTGVQISAGQTGTGYAKRYNREQLRAVQTASSLPVMDLTRVIAWRASPTPAMQGGAPDDRP